MRDVIKKTILPLAFLAFWFWMVGTIMRASGCDEKIIWLFLMGFPFGLHRMCILLIPKGMDIGGTVGVAALSVIIGGVMGCIMIPYYILRAVYVLFRFIFSLCR